MGEIIYPVREKIIDKMVIDDGNVKHSIIKVNDSDEWMRERAEMVMLRIHSGKTEIFLQKKEMYGGILKFKLPGGLVNDNESFEDAAIRECQEEALATVDEGSIVGNRNTFDYIVKCDKCHPWVEKNIPEKYRWRSYYTKVYAAYYSDEYAGFINDVDKDDIANEGQWYVLSPEIASILTPVHHNIIILCIMANMHKYIETMPDYYALWR